MRTVEFYHLFDDNNAARVRFELDRDQVVRFVVQLECLFDKRWHPVIRYDTAHDFAHCDIMHPTGRNVKKAMSTQDYNEALTFAIKDLSENWEKYRWRYERWLQQHP